MVIQNASDQKTEMEKIKGKMAQEVSKIEERKAKIDDELKEVQVCCQPDSLDWLSYWNTAVASTFSLLANSLLLIPSLLLCLLITAALQPLVDEAKRAVGNIKPEALSEIRSLRMPPDVIRDILEGVLRLMGIFDTSWVSMKRWEGQTWVECVNRHMTGGKQWWTGRSVQSYLIRDLQQRSGF